MARRSLGMPPGNEGTLVARARSWLSSARGNFSRIRKQRNRGGCSTVEHYTDVIAEATAASALATEGGNAVVAREAEKLASTATKAQRGATALCKRGK